MRTAIVIITMVAVIVARAIAQDPAGKAAGSAELVQLGPAADGATVVVARNGEVVVRLAGNPTTGYTWTLMKIEGDALREKGEVEYVQDPATDGRVGVGGTCIARFEAVKEGATTIRMQEARPWEKDTAPEKTFAVTVLVGGEGEPKGDQGVTGKVIKMVGNFMPGSRPPSGTRRVLRAPVHVFKGKVKPFEVPNRAHPQLVLVSLPRDDGSFRVPLEPGDYTVVAEIAGRLSLNRYAGDGSWSTVSVQKGEWAAWDVEDSSEASF